MSTRFTSSARLASLAIVSALLALSTAPAAEAGAGHAARLAKTDAASVRVEVGHRHYRRAHRHHRHHYRHHRHVHAPYTYVGRRHRHVVVDAPFAYVDRSYRGVHVRAPFVNLWVPRWSRW